MTSFTEILNTPFEDIKPPKPLPAGEYLGLVDGVPEITKRGKNDTDCIVFPIRLVQPVNVDATALAEALDGKALTDIKLSHTVWVTPESAWRMKAFLKDHLGIKATNGSQALAEAPGKQLMVTIGHYVTNKDGEAPRVGMQINATARAQ